MAVLLTIDPVAQTGDDSVAVIRSSWLVRTGQTLIVGRDQAAADIVIAADSAVSRRHLKIECDAAGCRLEDLNSRHGTLVNGQAAMRSVLAEGDIIAVGETRFIVRAASFANALVEASQSSEQVAVETRPRLTLQILCQRSVSASLSAPEWLYVTMRPGETLTIGRVAGQVSLAFPSDAQMSGKHLQLTMDRSGRCRATDLKSSNGSFLNGLMFSDERIRHGDEIQIGNAYLLVHASSEEAARRPDPVATAGSVEFSRGQRHQRKVQNQGYQIVNATPFPMAPVVGRLGFPDHSLTLIVKGTFQLIHDQPMQLAPEQALPTDSQPEFDPDAPEIAPRYESDFAFFKPRADILLVGHAYAPHRTPVPRLPVAIQVGELRHALEVHGARFWKRDRQNWTTTEPEPFLSLELCHQHTFGGESFADNPQGIGAYRKQQYESGSPLPLPRILLPGTSLSGPDQIAEPAGFGPLSRWTGRRLRQLGSYGADWQKHRWPWFPTDFEWEHFNAAPAAMQWDGYLRGDESVTLTNLHSEHSEYRSQLPAVRVRCFINPIGSAFREVPMHLDTLWMDADAEQSVLVWRGNTSITSEECENVRHVFVMSQPLEETPLSLNDCHAALLKQLAEREQEYQPPLELPPKGSEPASPTIDSGTSADAVNTSGSGGQAPPVEDPAMQLLEAEMRQLQAQIHDAQVAAGVDPVVLEKQVEVELARLTLEWGLESGIPPADFHDRIAMEFWKQQKQIHDAQVAAGVEPIPLPDPPQPMVAESVQETEAAGWTREKVIAHHAAGGSFAGAQLSGLDLSELDLSGADLQMALLNETCLVGSTLARANLRLASLASANLTSADLSEAVLEHADASGAILHQARLDRVQASRAILAQTWLTDASMLQADLKGACFVRADLSRASLNEAQLDKADFAEARLNSADLSRCSLISASLESASAREATFDFSDLTQLRASGCDCALARFHQVRAAGSIWEQSVLTACDFTWADLQRANLIKAVLKDARMTAANLAGAKLTSAVMRRVSLTDANLFEASVQKADLRRADLSRSSLYGAEVSEALWDECVLDSVNFRMTKMA